MTFLDDYGVPVAPVIGYQLKDQNKLAQDEEMQDVGSLDGIVILDNVQSYNLFQQVSKDKEQGSGLGSVDYQEQDLLPGDEDYRDDPRDEEISTSIDDNDHSDKISIGFKVDKTSDIITLLEDDRTKKIPEVEKFQHRDQGDAENKSSQDKVEVKKEESPLEFINDLESLVFRENTLEKVNNVTSVETFSNFMSQKTEENQLSSENGNKITKNCTSTIINRQRQKGMQLNQDKGDKIDRILDTVDLENMDDVVYILYLSKDGLNDLSNDDDDDE